MDELRMVLKSGRELVLTADYRAYMKDETFTTDWDEEISEGSKPYEEGTLKAYVNGKLVSESKLYGGSSYEWRVSDLREEQVAKTGCTKAIHALNIALEDDNAEKYEAWKNSIIENGMDEEVKKYEAEKYEAWRKSEIEYCTRYIRKAELYIKNKGKLMTAAEYKKWRINYNNLFNEGGEGYIPDLPILESYNRAKSDLEKLQNEEKKI